MASQRCPRAKSRGVPRNVTGRQKSHTKCSYGKNINLDHVWQVQRHRRSALGATATTARVYGWWLAMKVVSVSYWLTRLLMSTFSAIRTKSSWRSARGAPSHRVQHRREHLAATHRAPVICSSMSARPTGDCSGSVAATN